MSLNSVVNSLVRAAAGIPSDISDSDLDKHVAKLLAEEAKTRETKWSELGLSGLLDSRSESPDPNAPRPNKRFLASVIRTVDGHNAALIKAQEQAAREVRIERGESSRSGRSGGGASRLFGGAMRGLGDRDRDNRSGRRDREDRDRDRDRDRSERYDRERRGDSRERRRGSRREDDRRRDRSRDKHRDRDSRGDRERRRERDYSDERRYRDSSRERSPRKRERRDRSRSPRETNGSSSRRATKHSSPSPSASSPRPSNPASNGHEIPSPPAPPPPSDPAPTPPPDSPPPTRLSKMDKYFNQSYDPRLDLGEVPKEGMIAAVGWDNMLAVLKERGKKPRQRSPGIFDEPISMPSFALRSPSPDIPRLESKVRKSKKEERKKKYAFSDDSEDERERAKRKEKRKKDKEIEKLSVSGPVKVGTGEGLMGMEYVKKGGVREWDKGK